MENDTHREFPEQWASNMEWLYGDLTRNWKWILALGILFIVLGIVGLGMSIALTVATVLMFGALLLVGGVFQIADAFKSRGWKGTLLHVLIALLYIATGLMLLSQPVAGSLILTVMLGGALIAIGILRIVIGYQMKKASSSWGWVVLAGVASLVLGGMILLGWPSTALWVIGLLVAIELIVHGCSCVMVALAARTYRNQDARTSSH